MLNITNMRTESVKIDWSKITFPLKAGTPISAAGLIKNDGNAIGITIDDIQVWPALTNITIAVAGEVSLAEVESSSGLTFTSACKKALSGIRFMGSNGASTDRPESTLNKVTEIDDESTDEEYPSAKAVYTAVHPISEAINAAPSSWKPTLVDGKLAAQTVNFDFAGRRIALCGYFLDLERLEEKDQWFFVKAGDTITIPTEEDLYSTGESKRTFTFAADGKSFEISDAKISGEDPETLDPIVVVDNTKAIPYFIMFI